MSIPIEISLFHVKLFVQLRAALLRSKETIYVERRELNKAVRILCSFIILKLKTKVVIFGFSVQYVQISYIERISRRSIPL